MDKNFADALDDLINEFIEGPGIDSDELISTLELKLMALREEARDD